MSSREQDTITVGSLIGIAVQWQRTNQDFSHRFPRAIGFRTVLTQGIIRTGFSMPDAEPVQQSLVSWGISALGLPYVVLLPLAGLLCFLLALIIVIRGKGAMAAAALVLIVNIPLLIGAFAAIQGGIASYTVIAMSQSAPRPSEAAAGVSTTLFALFVGMLFTAPGYATAAFGASIRALKSGQE